MSKISPADTLSLGIYHFSPAWTHNYGESKEKRYEEFEDVIKSGYFNSVLGDTECILDDNFWRIIFENDCKVWLNVWGSFNSDEKTIDEWIKPIDDALNIVKTYPDRWELFCGFHFDEPIWRGQSNADFLEQTKTLRERYNKRVFPVFATGEFFDSEGNANAIQMDAKNMHKVKAEALKYVTDIAFDSYSVDVRDGYGNGSYINEMHQKLEGIVDGKTYYSELAKVLLSMVDHEVNIWFFPTIFMDWLWRGAVAGEGFCQGHLNYMADLVKTFKHPGGLMLYTYYKFKNSPSGLQTHLVVKNEEGGLKLLPETEKWWDYCEDLKRLTREFKETKVDLVK